MITLILKATADDESVTAGYLYKEINDISRESAGKCESLAEYLVDRLRNNSCHVKFKVLKVIKQLLENGSRDFNLAIYRHSPSLQQCTKFGGPPHPIHGNTPYLMVRKLATEVCSMIYSMKPEEAHSIQTEEASPLRHSKYEGLGPSGTAGSIQGFGNTPTNQSKGLGETILGGLEKLSAKMSDSSIDRQAMLLDMSGSSGSYQPPVVPSMGSPDVFTTGAFATGENHPVARVSPLGLVPSTRAVSVSSVTAADRPVKKPTPGKAGGGWGDDDDDSDEDRASLTQGEQSISSHQPSSIDTDSLVDHKSKAIIHDDVDPEPDLSHEKKLLTQTLATGSTGIGKIFLAPSQVSAFIDSASKLNVSRLVEMLAQKLCGASNDVVLRSLQLLEGLLNWPEELVRAETMRATCSDTLVSCYRSRCACMEEHQAVHNQAELDPDSYRQDDSCEGGVSSKKELNSSVISRLVSVKTAKLILMLQKLSPSTKEILPAYMFNVFLPQQSSCKVATT